MTSSIMCISFIGGDISRGTQQCTAISLDYIYVSNANITLQERWQKKHNPLQKNPHKLVVFVILAKQILMSRMRQSSSDHLVNKATQYVNAAPEGRKVRCRVPTPF